MTSAVEVVSTATAVNCGNVLTNLAFGWRTLDLAAGGKVWASSIGFLVGTLKTFFPPLNKRATPASQSQRQGSGATVQTLSRADVESLTTQHGVSADAIEAVATRCRIRMAERLSSVTPNWAAWASGCLAGC